MTFIKRVPAGSLKRTHQIAVHPHKCFGIRACLWPMLSLCLLLVLCFYLLAELNLYTSSQTFEMQYFVLREREAIVAVIFSSFGPQGWNEMISHTLAEIDWSVIFGDREITTHDKMQHMVYPCLLWKSFGNA